MELNQEIKEQILNELAEGKDVKNILKEFNISLELIDDVVESETGLSVEEYQASKLMSKLIKNGELEKAKILGNNFSENAKIQSKLMKVYMIEGKINDAIQISERFLRDEVIQSQLIEILFERKQYNKIKEIAKRFPEYNVIQSQLMKMYIKLRDFNNAKEIAKRFPEDQVIQCQLMTLYMEMGNVSKVKKIAEKFPNNPIMQSQLMKMHIALNEIDEAKKIAEKFSEHISIQSQLIKIYSKEGKIKEIEEISEKFFDNEIIQLQVMTIYMKLGNRDKVIELASRFPNNKKIQEKYRRYMSYEKENMNENDISCERNEELEELFDKINRNPYDEELSKQISEIDDKWLILSLYTAMAEKRGTQKDAIKRLKKINQEELDKNQRKAINSLTARIKKKQNIFDVGFYVSLIEDINQGEKDSKETDECNQKLFHDEGR